MNPSRIEKDHNDPGTGQVTLVAQAAWALGRRWHGEKVTLRVRTWLVKDGTAVKLEIKPAAGATAVDPVDGLQVTAGALDHEYTIAWKRPAVDTNRTFTFTATVGTDVQVITADAPALYVDLDDPMFSG